LTGAGIGQLRTIQTLDGHTIVERLEAIDDAKQFLRYTNITGIGVSHYTSALEVKRKDSGCVVNWRAQFLAVGKTDRAVKVMVSTWFKTGLESLKPRFGVAG
jgi:hypothetical protein